MAKALRDMDDIELRGWIRNRMDEAMAWYDSRPWWLRAYLRTKWYIQDILIPFLKGKF